MYEPNVAKILERVADPAALVLDVGGWACPFNRANWVLDAGPYETRGYYASIGLPRSQGGDREHFSRETWVQRDICDRSPWPWPDKHFDFSIGSHTLEDVRDPLFVCSELIRVSKAGYIETPSRLAEQSRGWESPAFVGLSHHRWLIEMDAGCVRFTPKYHCVHGDFRLSFPQSFLRSLPRESMVVFMFWEGSFRFTEPLLHGADQARELESFVARHYRHPRWRFGLQRCAALVRRWWNGIERRVSQRALDR